MSQITMNDLAVSIEWVGHADQSQAVLIVKAILHEYMHQWGWSVVCFGRSCDSRKITYTLTQ
jgi:hypothetical protein